MSRVFRIFLITLLVAVSLLALPARAADLWRINEFHSDIAIGTDGRVDIRETLRVSYSSEKHGIYRTLPYAYKNGAATEYSKVEVISVERNGTTEPYVREQNSAKIRLKIGSADKTISGVHTYLIHYRVSGILRGFDRYDELYWNVTGNDWEVPVQKVSAKVTLPSKGLVQASCYYGPEKSASACDHDMSDPTVTFSHDGSLNLGEGMTVAVGYAKGLVPLITVDASETRNPMLHPTTLKTAAIASLMGLLLLIYARRRYGSDTLRNESIAPEYTPPENLRPAEIGLLIDQKADTLDVSSTIVDLATRGYLTITEEPKKWLFGSSDYIFKRIKSVNEGLKKFESMLLDRLFEDASEEEGVPAVRLSSLKNTFYTDLADIKKQLYTEGTEQGYFPKNPEHVRTAYVLGALFGLIITAGIIASLASTALRFNTELPTLLFLGIMTGLATTFFLGIFFSFSMARRTGKGHDLFRRSMGYRLFLSNTEKYRQPFFENQNIFMEILPYAMVFGVTKKLAEAFERMGIQPPQPSWYYGPHAFNIASFNESMDTFSNTLSTAMASSPSSSGSGGGGFSGGGFGGGGGGSW